MKGHREVHGSGRSNWLRAAVLGANDGLISTSSLVLGVAAAQLAPGAVLLSGLAGLVGGALSMAAGEYVSVSAQADSEDADLARERRELATVPEAELRELTGIYVGRGLTPELAEQVARQLMAHDALGAHARDELGITEHSRARPLVAAAASAAAFAAGAALPLALVLFAPASRLALTVFVVAWLLLVVLGALGAWLGRAPPLRAALRVGFWGMVAMGVTYFIGDLVGTGVGV